MSKRRNQRSPFSRANRAEYLITSLVGFVLRGARETSEPRARAALLSDLHALLHDAQRDDLQALFGELERETLKRNASDVRSVIAERDEARAELERLREKLRDLAAGGKT